MSTSEGHTWEKDIPLTIGFTQRSKPNTTPVRDSWDDDDDEDEDENDKISDAEIIWERENSRSPMPQVQLSTTMAASGISLPPPAAFKEPLRILKRFDNKPKLSSTSPSNTHAAKTLEEREAQYMAARKRIFGDKGVGIAFSSSSLTESSGSVVIRDPIGPPSGNQNSNFRRRQKTGDHFMVFPSKETPDARSSEEEQSNRGCTTNKDTQFT